MSFANAPGFATQDALAAILEEHGTMLDIITKDFGLAVTAKSGTSGSNTIEYFAPNVAIYVVSIDGYNAATGEESLRLDNLSFGVPTLQARTIAFPKPLRFTTTPLQVGWMSNVASGSTWAVQYYLGEQ